MGAVNTNSVSIAFTEETSLGIPEVAAIAEYLEPNDITDYGADITTTARNPISKDRQNKKGTITDFSSTVGFTGDATASLFLAFLEGAMLSTWSKRPAWFGGEISASTTNSGFTLTTAMSGALMEGMILYCRGFVNGANNGLKVVDAGSTASVIKIVGGASMVNEAAPEGASVFVVGYEGAAGAIAVDSTGNLIASGFSWEDLGLEIGSAIYIGGITDSTSFAVKDNAGLARVREVGAATLVIDKREQAFQFDDGATKSIQIFFGWFLRNVPVDDPRFKERSYAFELAYPGLGDTDNDAYEYSLGNIINTFEISLPLNEKAETTVTTFGKDVEPITETRRGWSFKKPLFSEAYSTPNDFLRLRMQNIDETGLTTYFKDATITINNNAGGENVLGKLGPAFVNIGNFDVSMDTTAVFTNKALTAKIRNNCTVTCDFCLVNNDAGFYFDIPAMTLGDGSRDFAVNEKVKIALSSNAFGDSALGYTLSQTFFPYLATSSEDLC